MSKQASGWGSYGVPFPSLWKLVANYDITLGARGRDAFGLFVLVTPKEIR